MFLAYRRCSINVKWTSGHSLGWINNPTWMIFTQSPCFQAFPNSKSLLDTITSISLVCYHKGFFWKKPEFHKTIKHGLYMTFVVLHKINPHLFFIYIFHYSPTGIFDPHELIYSVSLQFFQVVFFSTFMPWHTTF